MTRWDIRKILATFILVGFISGIFYGNVFAKEYILSLELFNDYYLKQYSDIRILTEDYIWYILRIRISPVLLLILAGCSKYRKIFVSLFLLWTGFSLGLILTSAVLRLKLKGIVFCIVSILPHFICYIAGYLMLFIYYMSYPNSRWNGSKTVSFILFWLLGIISECYINPGLVELVITRF